MTCTLFSNYSLIPVTGWEENDLTYAFFSLPCGFGWPDSYFFTHFAVILDSNFALSKSRLLTFDVKLCKYLFGLLIRLEAIFYP